MTTIAITTFRPEPSIAFRSFMRAFGAKLRRAIELSAAPYMVMGSRYL
jgi:hypothetical protein